MKSYRLAAVLLLVCCGQLWSESASTASLVIIGPGDPIYTYWGHIGIIIDNRETDTSRFYDFGNFSFYSKNFYADFTLGRMRYLGLETDASLAFLQIENRNLNVYPLNLTEDEVRNLEERLRWWVAPENREYLYDYFYKNCSTIIRDVLDEITCGELKEYTEGRSYNSFRHYSRTGSNPSLASELLVHFLLGPAQDRPISGWELMFLPQAVADFSMEIQREMKDGTVLPLAGEPQQLKIAQRPPIPAEPRMPAPFMFILGLILAVFWHKSALGACQYPTQSRYRAVTGTVFRVLVVLMVGLPGALLGFLTAFTDHAASYGNINLWPSFPTILLALLLLLAQAAAKKSQRKEKLEKQIAGLITLNLIGLGAAMVLRFSKLFPQDSYAFWAFWTPLFLTASRIGFGLRQEMNALSDVGFSPHPELDSDCGVV